MDSTLHISRFTRKDQPVDLFNATRHCSSTHSSAYFDHESLSRSVFCKGTTHLVSCAPSTRTPACEAVARRLSDRDARFVYRTQSQDALTSEDIDGNRADLVFLDAAHDLALNQATADRVLPLLAERGILAIHDTGAVPRALLDLPDGHWMLASPELWVDDQWEHQPEERAFVNWLLETHPEFAQIHLHSSHTVRSGLTMLQRFSPLPRPPGSQSSTVR
jgi:hypothetical protein